jgi:PHD/YefM family antitoxin component YafN of YafNO toxin-antitoxin module
MRQRSPVTLDNDGNGYIDDVSGWDFYSDDEQVYDAAAPAQEAHGTHIAA